VYVIRCGSEILTPYSPLYTTKILKSEILLLQQCNGVVRELDALITPGNPVGMKVAAIQHVPSERQVPSVGRSIEGLEAEYS